MNDIRISIVVPNYNHSQYLPKCLTALLQQTVAPYEIIVIDDASTDNSVAVIQQYMQQAPIIKLLQNPENLGVFPNINRGLHAAVGTHVLFAAADDWLEPTMIAAATQALQQHPQAGLWSSGSWISYEEDPHQLVPALMFYPSKHSIYINPEQARKLLFKLDSWFMGNTVILNRKYLLQENGFIKELHSFADNFLYRILVAKHGCCFNPNKLSTWRIRKDGYALSLFSNLDRQRAIIAQAKTLTLNTYADIFNDDLAQRIIKRLEFTLARSIWINGKQNKAADLIAILGLQNKSKLMQQVIITLLQTSGKLPYLGNKIVAAWLFLLMRPYDVVPQLRLRARQMIRNLVSQYANPFGI